jgi:hypothetical protein
MYFSILLQSFNTEYLFFWMCYIDGQKNKYLVSYTSVFILTLSKIYKLTIVQCSPLDLETLLIALYLMLSFEQQMSWQCFKIEANLYLAIRMQNSDAWLSYGHKF